MLTRYNLHVHNICSYAALKNNSATIFNFCRRGLLDEALRADSLFQDETFIATQETFSAISDR